MTKQKLDIKSSLNGYEFIIKDVTGFGPEGYSQSGLNVNNVQAVVFVIKNSKGQIVNSKRIEGVEKNEFMTGLADVTISSKETLKGFPELRPDLYTVESYLINKVVTVKGLANQSEITGTDLDAALEDNFVIDDTLVYEVDPTYTNGGTVLQLRTTLSRFFNKGSFGFKFEHKVVNYVKIVKLLYKLSCMKYKNLVIDGEARNFAVLTGHLNVIKWNEEQGNTEALYQITNEASVLTDHLNLRYFRL